MGFEGIDGVCVSVFKLRLIYWKRRFGLYMALL